MKETRLLCMLMALLFSVLCAVPAQARWYGAEEGRFISVAPYSPDVEHPYVLCDNDPVNYIDPDGDLKIRIGDWEWGSGSTPGEWMGDFWDGMIETYIPTHVPGQDFLDCFGKCLKCNNAANPYAAGAAWLGAGGPHPKFPWNPGKSRLGSIFRRVPRWMGGGYLRKYSNFIKGRPWKWGKWVGRGSGAILIGEGMWALGVEAKCAAECAGDSNSY